MRVDTETPIAPQKDEHLGVKTEVFNGAIPTQDSLHSAALSGNTQTAKAFATLQAHAALARCSLHELASGTYLLCLSGIVRELPDLRSVAAVLRQLDPGRSM